MPYVLAGVLNLKNHRFQEFKDQGGAGDTLVKLGLLYLGVLERGLKIMWQPFMSTEMTLIFW